MTKMTVESFKADYPAIAEALIEEGRASIDIEQIRREGYQQGQADGIAQGKAAGALAEKDRIKGVLDHSMPGHEALVEHLAFDGKTTPAEAAAQILKAEKQNRAGVIEELRADSAEAAAVRPSAQVEQEQNDTDTGEPVEDRCKKRWEQNAKLRGEFTSLEAYIAYEKALAGGKLKILGRKTA